MINNELLIVFGVGLVLFAIVVSLVSIVRSSSRRASEWGEALCHPLVPLVSLALWGVYFYRYLDEGCVPISPAVKVCGRYSLGILVELGMIAFGVSIASLYKRGKGRVRR